MEQDDFVEIKFVFVHPEYRRQGWFTGLLSLLKDRKKRIVVCSQRDGMIRALVALGFSLKGKSKDGNELNYILEPTDKLRCKCK